MGNEMSFCTTFREDANENHKLSTRDSKNADRLIENEENDHLKNIDRQLPQDAMHIPMQNSSFISDDVGSPSPASKKTHETYVDGTPKTALSKFAEEFPDSSRDGSMVLDRVNDGFNTAKKSEKSLAWTQKQSDVKLSEYFADGAEEMVVSQGYSPNHRSVIDSIASSPIPNSTPEADHRIQSSQESIDVQMQFQIGGSRSISDDGDHEPEETHIEKSNDRKVDPRPPSAYIPEDKIPVANADQFKGRGFDSYDEQDIYAGMDNHHEDDGFSEDEDVKKMREQQLKYERDQRKQEWEARMEMERELEYLEWEAEQRAKEREEIRQAEEELLAERRIEEEKRRIAEEEEELERQKIKAAQLAEVDNVKKVQEKK